MWALLTTEKRTSRLSEQESSALKRKDKKETTPVAYVQSDMDLFQKAAVHYETRYGEIKYEPTIAKRTQIARPVQGA